MDKLTPGGIPGESPSMQYTKLDNISSPIDDETWSKMLEAAQSLQQPVVSKEQAPNTSQDDSNETLLQEALLAFRAFSSSSFIPAPSVGSSQPSTTIIPKPEPVDDETFLIALQNAQAFLGTSADRTSSGWSDTMPPTSSATTLEPRPTVSRSISPLQIPAAVAEPATSKSPPLTAASTPRSRTPEAEPVSGEYRSVAGGTDIPSTGNVRGPLFPDNRSLIRLPAKELERPDPRDLQQQFHHLHDPTYCIFRGADLEKIFRLDSETEKDWENSPSIYPPTHFVSVIADPVSREFLT